MERPNWQQYIEEQRGKEAPKKGAEGAAMICPRCGWVAKDAAAYKKHKRSAKAKTKDLGCWGLGFIRKWNFSTSKWFSRQFPQVLLENVEFFYYKMLNSN